MKDTNIGDSIDEYEDGDLGHIPHDWHIVPLGQLVDNKRPISYGIVQTGSLVENGVPCIRVTDIIDGEINKADLITTSQKISDGYKRTILRKGDLVMALRGKIGQVAKIDDDLVGANLTRGVALIALKEIYNNDFLKHQLSSDRSVKLFEKSLNGSALQELSIGVVRKIPITVPSSLTEQIAIAAILNNMDELINQNNKLIAQKELRKKWLMQNLLSGKKRLKGFTGKWRSYTYEQLIKVVKRPIQWNDNEIYKLISVRRRSGGIFLRESLQGNQIKVKNLRSVRPGDFLFSKMQILHGASALVTKEFTDTKISGSYIAVVSKDESLLNIEFLNLLSKTKRFYHQTYISSYGVHIEKMTFDFETFLNLETALPSVNEQTAICKIIGAIDEELIILKEKGGKLNQQKKGLMQLLLTGKKRLKIEL